MKPVRIPRRIDEPPHFLMWSADEIAPMLLGLTVGVFIGQVFICLIVGVLVTNFYKKFRDNHPDGFILHLIYWHGFTKQKKNGSMKNPFIRRYLP